MRPAFRRIAEAAASHFQLPLADLIGPSHRAPVVRARHIAMYLCRRTLAANHAEIGRQFGRDGTTVHSSIRRVETYLAQSDIMRGHVEVIERQIRVPK